MYDTYVCMYVCITRTLFYGFVFDNNVFIHTWQGAWPCPVHGVDSEHVFPPNLHSAAIAQGSLTEFLKARRAASHSQLAPFRHLASVSKPGQVPYTLNPKPRLAPFRNLALVCYYYCHHHHHSAYTPTPTHPLTHPPTHTHRPPLVAKVAPTQAWIHIGRTQAWTHMGRPTAPRRQSWCRD